MHRALLSYVIERSRRNETVRLGGGLGLMCAYKIRIQRLRTGYDNLASLKKMVHKLRDEWSKGSKAAWGLGSLFDSAVSVSHSRLLRRDTTILADSLRRQASTWMPVEES